MLAKGIRKVRATGLTGLVRAARPIRIDELMYELRIESLPSGDAALDVRAFDRRTRSGVVDIDRKLVGARRCYVARVAEQIAHTSWVFFDTLLPQQFGFDRHVPVIGDCVTVPAHRGHGLYPKVLRFIAADLRARGIADRCYILVGSDNAASIRGIEKAGGQLLGHLRGIRVFGYMVRKRRTT